VAGDPENQLKQYREAVVILKRRCASIRPRFRRTTNLALSLIRTGQADSALTIEIVSSATGHDGPEYNLICLNDNARDSRSD